MPYRQNFPIPPVIDPPRMCLCLPIPNSPEWKAVVAGLLSELTLWFNYERTGDNSGALCAAVWKDIYRDIDWSTMSCCCSEFTVIFQWTEDGVLQQSDDGGVTWENVPEQDPRNSSTVYPPVPGDASDDKRCVAAVGMMTLIKEQIGDQLTDDMSRYTLGQLIKDWVTTIIQTSNPFQALLNIVTNQIFALLISAVRAALTEDVYDQLKCIFDCNMSDDLSFSSEQWETVRSEILDQITGIAGVFLEHLVFLLGKVGLTNLARSQAATEGSCGDCPCDDSCNVMDWEQWTALGSLGTILSYGADYVEVQSEMAGAFGAQAAGIYLPSGCCHYNHPEAVGYNAGLGSYYSDCGHDPSDFGGNHNTPFAVTCGTEINMITLYGGTSVFTVKFYFDGTCV